MKKDKNKNEESLNDMNIFNNNRQIDNLINNNNNQFMPGDMYMGMGGISPNSFIQKNYPQIAYGMNNLLMQNYEQQNPQMFHANPNNNLNYSFQLNEDLVNNNVNKKLKKNNNSGNINLNLNKAQLNYDISNNLSNSMNLGCKI